MINWQLLLKFIEPRQEKKNLGQWYGMLLKLISDFWGLHKSKLTLHPKLNSSMITTLWDVTP
jgi:hypothetical protein